VSVGVILSFVSDVSCVVIVSVIVVGCFMWVVVSALMV